MRESPDRIVSGIDGAGGDLRDVRRIQRAQFPLAEERAQVVRESEQQRNQRRDNHSAPAELELALAYRVRFAAAFVEVEALADEAAHGLVLVRQLLRR